MTENIKNFTEELITFDKLMERLEKGKSPTNFTGGKGSTLRKEKFGRLSLSSCFNGDNGSGRFNGNVLTPEQAIELVGDGSNWNFTGADNTYNHNGYLERDVNFNVFENTEDDTVLCFLMVHIGLDIRAGYTNYIAIQYDNEYDMQEDFMDTYNVGGATFKQGGKEIYVSLDCSPVSEYVNVYISDEGNNEILSDETYELDLYDKEDFVKSFYEYLKQNDIDFDENSLVVD